MAKKVIKTDFLTEIDAFLREYEKNRTHFPASRQREVKKYGDIYAKRDGVVAAPEKKIWKDF